MGGAVSSSTNNDDMITKLIGAGYIKSQAAERAFRAVDRGNYVLSQDEAYADHAWLGDKSVRDPPAIHDQEAMAKLHISAPCIYAQAFEGLHIEPGQRFLNIGSGTGYFSTVVGTILGIEGVNHGVELREHTVDFALERLQVFKTMPGYNKQFFAEPVFERGDACRLAGGSTKYHRIYCGVAISPTFLNFLRDSYLELGGVIVAPVKDKFVQIYKADPHRDLCAVLLGVSFASLSRVKDDPKTVVTMPEMSVPSLQELCRVRVLTIVRDRIKDELPTRGTIFAPIYSAKYCDANNSCMECLRKNDCRISQIKISAAGTSNSIDPKYAAIYPEQYYHLLELQKTETKENSLIFRNSARYKLIKLLVDSTDILNKIDDELFAKHNASASSSNMTKSTRCCEPSDIDLVKKICYKKLQENTSNYLSGTIQLFDRNPQFNIQKYEPCWTEDTFDSFDDTSEEAEESDVGSSFENESFQQNRLRDRKCAIKLLNAAKMESINEENIQKPVENSEGDGNSSSKNDNTMTRSETTQSNQNANYANCDELARSDELEQRSSDDDIDEDYGDTISGSDLDSSSDEDQFDHHKVMKRESPDNLINCNSTIKKKCLPHSSSHSNNTQNLNEFEAETSAASAAFNGRFISLLRSLPDEIKELDHSGEKGTGHSSQNKRGIAMPAKKKKNPQKERTVESDEEPEYFKIHKVKSTPCKRKSNNNLWTRGTDGYSYLIDHRRRNIAFEDLSDMERLELRTLDRLQHLPVPAIIKHYIYQGTLSKAMPSNNSQQEIDTGEESYDSLC